MAKTVSGLECRYQEKVTSTDVADALAAAECQHCGVTTRVLMESGELLEVCGDMFGIDMITHERVITPISLCPDCHRKHHLDADKQHQPCQVQASFSREGLT